MEVERENSTTVVEKEKQPEIINPLFEKYKSLSTIKRAIRASARFNKKFNKQRSEERKAYFDMQTMSIHYPQPANKNLIKPTSSIGQYPVAIFPWQYQDYYQKYTPTELEKLPVNTPLKSLTSYKNLYQEDYLFKVNEDREKWKAIALERTVKQQALEERLREMAQETSTSVLTTSLTSDQVTKIICTSNILSLAPKDANETKSSNDETDTISIDSLQKTNQVTGDWCHVCGFPPLANSILKGNLITCSECTKTGHPACLGLTLKMSQLVMTYPWQCIDCKNCSHCLNPGDEAEMMCCDACDRGYHTFCVGLRSIPEGEWVCTLCKE